MKNTGRHYWVVGKVQGVAYRAFAQQQARNLGITGWVRNRADGRVELVAYGDPEKLDVLQARLQQGPPSAKVTQLHVSEHPFEADNDFLIR